MTFEYNENKSKTNKLKHGIDFNESQKLWDDPYAFELKSSQAILLMKIDIWF
jgi:uncharacterized DUF497 family protein